MRRRSRRRARRSRRCTAAGPGTRPTSGRIPAPPRAQRHVAACAAAGGGASWPPSGWATAPAHTGRRTSSRTRGGAAPASAAPCAQRAASHPAACAASRSRSPAPPSRGAPSAALRRRPTRHAMPPPRPRRRRSAQSPGTRIARACAPLHGPPSRPLGCQRACGPAVAGSACSPPQGRRAPQTTAQLAQGSGPPRPAPPSGRGRYQSPRLMRAAPRPPPAGPPLLPCAPHGYCPERPTSVAAACL